MVVGFDGKGAVGDQSARGNYSRDVIEGLAKSFPDDRLLVYTPTLRENPFLDKFRTLGNTEFRLPPPQGFSGSLWRTFGISNHLRADKVDIFHGLDNELPLNIRSSGVPAVVTVHDVMWRRMPQCFNAIGRFTRDYKCSRACRNADHIIATSQRTKDDIVEFYGVDPGKISVILQDCTPQFRRRWNPDELLDLRKRLNLPERYLLQVGDLEERSNIGLSVRALTDISPDMHLVVAGRDRNGYRRKLDRLAATSGVTARITYLEDIDPEDLPGVYRNAEIALLPSRYEGSVTPALEALESGVPLIAATGGGLEEAGGDEALYVDPDSPQDMAQAVHALLSDPSATRYMADAGRERAAQLRQGNTAASLREIYRQVIATARH